MDIRTLKAASLILVLLQGCTRSNTGPAVGSCVQSMTGSGQTDSSERSSVSSSALDIASLGGFIELEKSNGDSGTMCTAYLEVESIPESSPAAELPVTVWTAKHCMSEGTIKDTAFRLSSKNADGENAYVRMPLLLDTIEGFKALRAAPGMSDAAFAKFAQSYASFSTRDPEKMGQFVDDARKKSSADTEESAINEILDGTYSMARPSLLAEKLAFGQSLCADRRSMDKNGKQKFCFTNDDLGAYRGKLVLKTFRRGGSSAIADNFVEEAVIAAGKKQIADRAAFEESLNSGKTYETVVDKAMKESPTEKNVISTLVGDWKTAFKGESKLTVQLAYMDSCKGTCAEKEAFQTAFKDLISAAESDGVAGLADDLSTELFTKVTSWNALGQNFLVGHADDLYFHTNSNYGGASSGITKESAYTAEPLRTIADGPGTPLLWRPYGLVFWSQSADSKLQVFKSDSGTVVTIGGVFPIAVVSSVNNDPTSGGIAISALPEYKSGGIVSYPESEGAGAGYAGNETNQEIPDDVAAAERAQPSGAGSSGNAPTGNGLPDTRDTAAVNPDGQGGGASANGGGSSGSQGTTTSAGSSGGRKAAAVADSAGCS